jgi:asparagine synthase (glutamine-hydrolysing)
VSGIAGIIHFDGAPVEPGQIEKMTAAMAHRGPDGIHHWVRGNVALGQCMLRTTPESLEETQPLANEDASLVLVMDGRVDNWEELRAELLKRGAALRTRADAELVLRAYEIWGKDCLTHIDGDFALVIWDARVQVAFCARDRMGNKPFHYHWDGRTLAFASELHAILELPWIQPELNEKMVAQYLAIEWYSRDETLWKGIQRLIEAHWMEVCSQGLRSAEYWRPDLFAPLPYRKYDEYVEHYRVLFFDTVQRLSRSHKKLAFEVSGGLDSSANFAAAKHLHDQHRLLAPDIEAFTLKFDDDSAANELEFCHAVSAHLGIPVHEVTPTIQPLRWYQEQARTFREFPGYPNGIMGLGIRELARERGCAVLFTGDGGDEWLGGSRAYYEEEMASGRWRNLYESLRTDCKEVGAKNAWRWFGRAGAILFLPGFAQEMLRKALACRKATLYDRQAWLTPRLRSIFNKGKEGAVPLFPDNTSGRIGHRAQIELLYDVYAVIARESEERLASHSSLELRKPFLNTAMVQFAFSTPERLRLRGDTNKILHRSAMTGLLPKSVLNRRTKADFMGVFRKHTEEIKKVLSRKVMGSDQDWVLFDQLGNTYTAWGDPIYGGIPEWMLWSLFGCSALLPDTLGQ